MLDGALRACVSLPGGGGAPHGWMTLVMRDGVENATFLEPQPPAELRGDGEGGEATELVAAGRAAGGLAFVF